jgi:2-amino-4-hydroxy-6-hydroxymethyldihydropteridine diphosphokinase
LSIGSNLGDPKAYLRTVVERLGVEVEVVSSLYETKPWGVTDQPNFLNAVILATGERDEYGWLTFAQRLESAADRVRDVRWGPRTLDVDVIAVYVDGRQVVSDDPLLTLPHPRAAKRAFVLLPLLEIAPEISLAGHGRVAELVAALPPGERSGVTKLDGDMRWWEQK